MRRGGPRARRIRLLALAGAVVCALGVPLAVASAGSVGSREAARAEGSSVIGSSDDAGDRERATGREGAGDHEGIGDRAGADDRAGTGDRAGAGAEEPAGRDDESTVDDESIGDDEAPSVRGDAVLDDLRSPSPLGLGPATAARCGPELTAPEGVEAQTCVLTRDGETWARTYYRNATGHALDAVLTLMGPADRTVQIRCAVGAGDEPASCETPREAGRGEAARYTAVAEFAERGGRGPLLLRVGSNSAPVTGS
ncbi:hypothetical protein AB0K93_02565 [Streptomyces sp. NPDC052676]|uniref:hypothetical protein n=1 Tax=Streptomyces sp. NPDC052676 TaxID=3154953 RepID=UPI003441471E